MNIIPVVIRKGILLSFGAIIVAAEIAIFTVGAINPHAFR